MLTASMLYCIQGRILKALPLHDLCVSQLCIEIMTVPSGPHGPSIDIKVTLLYYLVTMLGEN